MKPNLSSALPTCIRCGFSFAGACWLLGAVETRAADGSWNVDDDGLWSEGAKWASNIIADGAGFTATFAIDQATDAAVSLDSPRTIGSLVFGDPDLVNTANSWTLNNNSLAANILTLSGGTPTITVNELAAGKTATVSAVLAGTEGLTKAGPGTLVLSGANTYTGSTTVNAGTLLINAANAVTTGVVVNGGTLQLDASNTYSGGTVIESGGTVVVNQVNGLGTGATVVQGTLNLKSTAAGDITYSGLGTVTGSGTINVDLLSAGTANTNFTSTRLLNGNYSGFSGTLNVGPATGVSGGKIQFNGADNASLTVNALPNATVYVSAAITKTASIVLSGGDLGETLGQLRVENNGVWSGPVDLAGAITGANDAYVGSQAGNGTISGLISESGGSRMLTKGGTANLIVTGANSFTGGTHVLAGTLTVPQIGLTGSPGPLGTGAILRIGNGTTGATFNYTGTGETTDRVIDLAGTTGGATVTHNGTGLLKLTGGVTATGEGAKTLTLQGNGSFEVAGAIADNSATNTTALTKAGTGILTLSAASTFSGSLNLNGGTIVVSHPSGLGAAEPAAPNKLCIVGAGAGGNPVTLDLATDTSIDPYRFWGSSNNPTTIIANRATPGAGITHAFGLNSGVGNNTYTFVAGPNVNSGTAAVTFASLSVAAGGAGTGTLNPTTAPVTILGPVSIAHNVAAKTLNLGGTNLNNAILGTVSDNLAVLSLAKSNTSTWTISGDRQYTGATSVSGGTLVLTGASYVTGTTTVSGGLLVYSGDQSLVSAASATTAVNGGILRLDYGTFDSSKLSNIAPLTLGGGTLELAGGSHVEQVSATTLTAGTSSTVIRSSGSAVLQMNGITAGAGALVNFADSGIATTDTRNTNGILGPWATITVAGVTDWATNSTNADDGPITAYAGYADVARLGGVIPNGATTNIRIVNGGAVGNVTLAANPNTSYTVKMDASDGPATIAPGTAADVVAVGGESGGTIWQTANAGGLTIGTGFDDGVLTTGGAPNAAAATLLVINDSTNDLVVNSTITNNGTDVVGLAKAGPGRLVLTGSNTFTGSTAVGGGMLQLGSASALGSPAAGTTLTLGAATALDLNGNNATVQNVTGHATGVVTDNGATAGTSTLAIANGGTSIAANLLDGPSRALALRVTNSNGGFFLTNGANTFSGGIVLTHSAAGTRMSPGTITAGAYGTGPVTVGESAADKAGIYFATANQTFTNPVVMNTALGTDRLGIRVDVAGIVMSGQLTANLAPATFAANGTGTVTLTGKVTGPNGLVLTPNAFDLTTTRSMTVILANAAGTNDYAGDTVVNLNALNYKNTALTLGAPDQVPNGLGAGNVTVNNSAGPSNIGTGTLNLAGFNETINGLTGTGTVTSSAGTPTLVVGDNDAEVNFTGVISGSLALTKTGAGAMTLGGATASTYTGVTILNSGLVTAGKGSAFGGTGLTSGTTINPGVTLNTNGQNFGAERFTLAGGVVRNDGAADQVNTMQRLAVTANSSVGGLRRWDVRGGGLGGLTVDAGVTLTKVDANLVAVVQNPLVNDGVIQIDQGTFGLHFAVAATGTGTFVVNPGTEFQIGSYGTPCTVANQIFVNGGTLAGINEQGGVSSFNGPISITGSATVRADTALNISGVINGAGALAKTGAGVLAISTAVAHTGDTTVATGTFRLTVPSTFADGAAVRLTTGATLDLTAAGTDTVNALFIDNVQQNSGTWGRTGSIADLGADHETALITGDGLLEVTTSGVTPYGAWAAAKGLTAGVNDGPTDNPDGDGLDNRAEFAFDGDPLSGRNDGKIVGKVATVGGGQVLTLTVPVRRNATFSGATEQVSDPIAALVYHIQGSDTLATGEWTLTVTEVTGPDAAAIQDGLPGLSDIDGDLTADWTYRTFRTPGTVTDGDPRDFLRAFAVAE